MTVSFQKFSDHLRDHLRKENELSESDFSAMDMINAKLEIYNLLCKESLIFYAELLLSATQRYEADNNRKIGLKYASMMFNLKLFIEEI